MEYGSQQWHGGHQKGRGRGRGRGAWHNNPGHCYNEQRSPHARGRGNRGGWNGNRNFHYTQEYNEENEHIPDLRENLNRKDAWRHGYHEKYERGLSRNNQEDDIYLNDRPRKNYQRYHEQFSRHSGRETRQRSRSPSGQRRSGKLHHSRERYNGSGDVSEDSRNYHRASRRIYEESSPKKRKLSPESSDDKNGDPNHEPSPDMEPISSERNPSPMKPAASSPHKSSSRPQRKDENSPVGRFKLSQHHYNNRSRRFFDHRRNRSPITPRANWGGCDNARDRHFRELSEAENRSVSAIENHGGAASKGRNYNFEKQKYSHKNPYVWRREALIEENKDNAANKEATLTAELTKIVSDKKDDPLETSGNETRLHRNESIETNNKIPNSSSEELVKDKSQEPNLKMCDDQTTEVSESESEKRSVSAEIAKQVSKCSDQLMNEMVEDERTSDTMTNKEDESLKPSLSKEDYRTALENFRNVEMKCDQKTKPLLNILNSYFSSKQSDSNKGDHADDKIPRQSCVKRSSSVEVQSTCEHTSVAKKSIDAGRPALGTNVRRHSADEAGIDKNPYPNMRRDDENTESVNELVGKQKKTDSTNSLIRSDSMDLSLLDNVNSSRTPLKVGEKRQYSDSVEQEIEPSEEEIKLKKIKTSEVMTKNCVQIGLKTSKLLESSNKQSTKPVSYKPLAGERIEQMAQLKKTNHAYPHKENSLKSGPLREVEEKNTKSNDLGPQKCMVKESVEACKIDRNMVAEQEDSKKICSKNHVEKEQSKNTKADMKEKMDVSESDEINRTKSERERMNRKTNSSRRSHHAKKCNESSNSQRRHDSSRSDKKHKNYPNDELKKMPTEVDSKIRDETNDSGKQTKHVLKKRNERGESKESKEVAYSKQKQEISDAGEKLEKVTSINRLESDESDKIKKDVKSKNRPETVDSGKEHETVASKDSIESDQSKSTVQSVDYNKKSILRFCQIEMSVSGNKHENNTPKKRPEGMDSKKNDKSIDANKRHESSISKKSNDDFDSLSRHENTELRKQSENVKIRQRHKSEVTGKMHEKDKVASSGNKTQSSLNLLRQNSVTERRPSLERFEKEVSLDHKDATVDVSTNSRQRQASGDTRTVSRNVSISHTENTSLRTPDKTVIEAKEVRRKLSGSQETAQDVFEKESKMEKMKRISWGEFIPLGGQSKVTNVKTVNPNFKTSGQSSVHTEPLLTGSVHPLASLKNGDKTPQSVKNSSKSMQGERSSIEEKQVQMTCTNKEGNEARTSFQKGSVNRENQAGIDSLKKEEANVDDDKQRKSDQSERKALFKKNAPRVSLFNTLSNGSAGQVNATSLKKVMPNSPVKRASYYKKSLKNIPSTHLLNSSVVEKVDLNKLSQPQEKRNEKDRNIFENLSLDKIDCYAKKFGQTSDEMKEIEDGSSNNTYAAKSVHESLNRKLAGQERRESEVAEKSKDLTGDFHQRTENSLLNASEPINYKRSSEKRDDIDKMEKKSDQIPDLQKHIINEHRSELTKRNKNIQPLSKLVRRVINGNLTLAVQSKHPVLSQVCHIGKEIDTEKQSNGALVAHLIRHPADTVDKNTVKVPHLVDENTLKVPHLVDENTVKVPHLVDENTVKASHSNHPFSAPVYSKPEQERPKSNDEQFAQKDDSKKAEPNSLGLDPQGVTESSNSVRSKGTVDSNGQESNEMVDVINEKNETIEPDSVTKVKSTQKKLNSSEFGPNKTLEQVQEGNDACDTESFERIDSHEEHSGDVKPNDKVKSNQKGLESGVTKNKTNVPIESSQGFDFSQGFDYSYKVESIGTYELDKELADLCEVEPEDIVAAAMQVTDTSVSDSNETLDHPIGIQARKLESIQTQESTVKDKNVSKAISDEGIMFTETVQEPSEERSIETILSIEKVQDSSEELSNETILSDPKNEETSLEKSNEAIVSMKESPEVFESVPDKSDEDLDKGTSEELLQEKSADEVEDDSCDELDDDITLIDINPYTPAPAPQAKETEEINDEIHSFPCSLNHKKIETAEKNATNISEQLDDDDYKPKVLAKLQSRTPQRFSKRVIDMSAFSDDDEVETVEKSARRKTKGIDNDASQTFYPGSVESNEITLSDEELEKMVLDITPSHNSQKKGKTETLDAYPSKTKKVLSLKLNRRYSERKSVDEMLTPKRGMKLKPSIDCDRMMSDLDIQSNLVDLDPHTVFKNGFQVSQKKVLKNNMLCEKSLAHLDPKRLYDKEMRGQCLRCESCQSYFTPLNFSVHHHQSAVLEKLDHDQSMVQEFEIVHTALIEQNSVANDIFRDFKNFCADLKSGKSNLPKPNLVLKMLLKANEPTNQSESRSSLQDAGQQLGNTARQVGSKAGKASGEQCILPKSQEQPKQQPIPQEPAVQVMDHQKLNQYQQVKLQQLPKEQQSKCQQQLQQNSPQQQQMSPTHLYQQQYGSVETVFHESQMPEPRQVIPKQYVSKVPSCNPGTIGQHSSPGRRSRQASVEVSSTGSVNKTSHPATSNIQSFMHQTAQLQDPVRQQMTQHSKLTTDAFQANAVTDSLPIQPGTNFTTSVADYLSESNACAPKVPTMFNALTAAYMAVPHSPDSSFKLNKPQQQYHQHLPQWQQQQPEQHQQSHLPQQSKQHLFLHQQHQKQQQQWQHQEPLPNHQPYNQQQSQLPQQPKSFTCPEQQTIQHNIEVSSPKSCLNRTKNETDYYGASGIRTECISPALEDPENVNETLLSQVHKTSSVIPSHVKATPDIPMLEKAAPVLPQQDDPSSVASQCDRQAPVLIRECILPPGHSQQQSSDSCSSPPDSLESSSVTVAPAPGVPVSGPSAYKTPATALELEADLKFLCHRMNIGTCDEGLNLVLLGKKIQMLGLSRMNQVVVKADLKRKEEEKLQSLEERVRLLEQEVAKVKSIPEDVQ